MDPGGLAVGVVPLLVGALKAYSAVHQYLRVFRHYASEIKRLFNRFEVQKCILENELDLILRKAAPPGQHSSSLTANALLTQPDSPALVKRVSTLDDDLRRSLCKHTEAFTGLLIGITEQLQELQNELTCFEVVKGEQIKGEPLKQTILRVKARVRIGFDKRRLRDLLDALKSDNEDLRSIGSYLTDKPRGSSYRAAVSTMPATVLKNRKVILALHESLTSCWTCVDPDHGDHVAKLCLEPIEDPIYYFQEPQEVKLDLAVACLPKVSTGVQQGLMSNPIWLYVRTATEVSSAGSTNEQSKRRKIDAIQTGTPGRTLVKHDSVCESLSKCKCNGKSTEACLTYSQPASGLRHLFYHYCQPPLAIQSSARSMALADVLPDVRIELSVEQQITLARRLALSVLELYKSPWLPGQWRMRDISSFSRPCSDNNEFAQRLHVTSTISGSDLPCAASSNSAWAVTTPNHMPDDMLLYGVNNDTLFSLGVALLEIAHGKPLEQFRSGTDQNLLSTAQRLSQRACPLGEKYRELARQCLRCDFGCGTELELRGLQDAVYTDVVGQLEGLMKVLKI